jgi:RNA polymerase sigma factor (sigma-70 family)
LHRRQAEKEFEKHIKEHELLLHKVCSMYADIVADREDLFQEIVIQLWRSFPNFKGESKISTWMYRVALNTAITGARKKRIHIVLHPPSNLPNHLHDETPETQKQEQAQELQKAIEHLTEIERAIVVLYLEEKSYDEMEQILGMNQVLLRVKMNRIKEKLRQFIKNSKVWN